MIVELRVVTDEKLISQFLTLDRYIHGFIGTEETLLIMVETMEESIDEVA